MTQRIKRATVIAGAVALFALGAVLVAPAGVGAQGGGCTGSTWSTNDGSVDVTGSWARGDCLGDRFGRRLWVDVYSFSLTATTRVDLELSSNERTPALVLATASGQQLASSAGAPRRQFAAINRTLSAGRYRVEATKADSGQGSYRLRGSFTALNGPGNGPPSAMEIRATLARALFGAGKATNHEYNLYGARPGSGCLGYDGGHSGWDAQTQSVAGAVPTKDEPFFSLNAGTVIRAGGTFNEIAVYDAAENLTTLYLHARQVDVRVGQRVRVGTRLGIQGNAGLSSDPTDREHVHVEVRSGRRRYAACGASTSISPYNYLYRQVVAAGN